MRGSIRMAYALLYRSGSEKRTGVARLKLLSFKTRVMGAGPLGLSASIGDKRRLGCLLIAIGGRLGGSY
jgi:hypothetical protein